MMASFKWRKAAEPPVVLAFGDLPRVQCIRESSESTEVNASSMMVYARLPSSLKRIPTYTGMARCVVMSSPAIGRLFHLGHKPQVAAGVIQAIPVAMIDLNSQGCVEDIAMHADSSLCAVLVALGSHGVPDPIVPVGIPLEPQDTLGVFGVDDRKLAARKGDDGTLIGHDLTLLARVGECHATGCYQQRRGFAMLNYSMVKLKKRHAASRANGMGERVGARVAREIGRG